MEAQHGSHYQALVKIADGPIAPAPGLTYAENDQARGDAAGVMAKMILGALSAGIVGRGALGLYQMANRRALPYTGSPTAQRVVVPIPKRKRSDEPGVPEEKLASEETGATGALKNVLKSTLFNVDEPTFNAEQAATVPSIGPAIQGAHAASPWGAPALGGFGIPLAMLAGAGGWYGVDKILNARRKAEQKDELEHAKSKYLNLIRQGFKEAALDELADDYVKQASWVPTLPEAGEWITGTALPETVKWTANQVGTAAKSVAESAKPDPATAKGLGNYGGMLGGAALGTGTLLALLAAHAAYKHRSKQEGDVTADALRLRAKHRTGGTPPVYVEPAAYHEPLLSESE